MHRVRFKTVHVNVCSMHGPQHPFSQGAWLHGLVRLRVAHKQPRRRAALRRGVVGGRRAAARCGTGNGPGRN